MPDGVYGIVFRDVRYLFGPGTVTGIDEALLLERFVSRRDEMAFAALVARFGPMVLAVCRRRLHDPHDVEDAFQATFLVLVRKAATIRDGDLLGNWLYGVACRVAARARANARSRRAREVAGAENVAVAPRQADEGDAVELEAVLDEELSRLPEKYRAPLLLCGLQGSTYEEAARRLNCPIGTVRSRTAKARELMRTRLARRGFALPAGVLAMAVAPAVSHAAVPSALMDATLAAAAHAVAGRAVTAGVVSASVGELTQGVLRAMSFTKLRIVAVTLVAMATVATGAGVLARQAAAPPPRREQDGNRAAALAPGAEDARSPTRPATPDQEAPNLKEDDPFDRFESLSLDVELLSNEVSSLKTILMEYSKSSASRKISSKDVIGVNPEQTELLRSEARKYDESMQRKMTDVRKEYLAKSKELRQKQRQLGELPLLPHGQALDDRQRNTTPGDDQRALANQLASSKAQAISPALEQRLSGMDQKLDQIKKALSDLSREQRR